MKSLLSYLIFENDVNDVAEIISTLDNMKDLADAVNNFTDVADREDKMKLQYISRAIDRLLNDREITNWFASTSNSQLELCRLLAKKLSPREARYMDEICQKLCSIEDDDPDIINNAVLRLMKDQKILDWHKSNGDRFELYNILAKKLNTKEKRQIDAIADKFLQMTSRVRR